MSAPKVLYGFHAVGVRLKTAPQSILEIYFDASRRDARMRQFLDKAREAGVRVGAGCDAVPTVTFALAVLVPPSRA